jgi:hypothetical protein
MTLKNITDNMMQRLLNTPLLRQLSAEEEAEIATKRMSATAKIRAATAKHLAAQPGREAAIAKASLRRSTLERELRDANSALALLIREDCCASVDLGQEILRNEKILRDSAPAEIDIFIAAMDALWEKTRREIYTREASRESSFGWIKLFESNAEVINRKIAAIRQARIAAEALKLDAEVDVASALEKLRAAIPDESTTPERIVYPIPPVTTLKPANFRISQ